MGKSERKSKANASGDEHFSGLLFENNPIPMFIFSNKDLRFLKVNHAAVNIYGYTTEEFSLMDVYDLHPKDEIEKLVNDQKKNKSEFRQNGDWHHIFKDGRIIDVEITSHNISYQLQDATLSIAFDITKRKESERELQKSEQRIKSILETQKDLIFRFKPDTTLLYVNDAYCSFYRVKREDVLGKSFLDYAQAIERERIKDYLESMIQNPRINNYEYKESFDDGRIIWWDWTDYPVYDEHGKLTEIQTVGRDITERKKLEETIIQNEAINEAILNNVPDLLFRLDKLGSYLDVKTGDPTKLLLPKEEFLGKSINEVLPPENAKQAMEALSKAFETASISTYEYSMTLQDGLHFFENRIVPVSENEAISIIRDVTERKLTEDALKKSEMRWQFALEGNGDGLWDWEINSEKVFFSDQWKEMIGYSPEEIQNTLSEWESRIHPDDSDAVFESLKMYLCGKRDSYSNEHRLLCKNGSYKWILVRGKVIERDESGYPKRIIGIHSDISARKEAEESLKAAKDELESFFDLSLDLLCISDLEGNFVKVNKAWEKILGLPAEKILGSKYYEFIHPDDQADRIDKADQLAKEGEVRKFTNRYISDDGSIRYLEWRSVSYNDLVYSVARDVTDREHYNSLLITSNMKLDDSNRMLKTILDVIPVRLFWKDLNLNYIGANQNFAADFGLKGFDNIKGLSDFDFCTQEMAEKYRADDKKVISTGRPIIGYEEELISKNGNVQWGRTSKVPLRDESGKITGVLGTYEDITQQKQASDAVLRNERFSRKLLQLLNDSLGIDNNEQLLQLISHRIVSLFDADTCFVTKWDEEKKQTIPLFSTDASINYARISGSDDELTLTDSLMKEEQIIMVEDVFNSTYISRGVAEEFSSRSLLGIPLIAGGRKIGAIIIGYNTERKFSLAEMERGNLATSILSLVMARNNFIVKLDRSEKTMRSFIENAPIGISATDRVGNYVLSNAEATKMFGYEPHEFMKMKVFDLVHDDSLDAGKKHFQEILEKGSAVSDVLLKRKDQSHLWCAVHGVKINENLFLAFHFDITDRVNTRLELGREKALLTGLLNSIPDIVFYKDLEGKYIGGNPEFAKIAGTSVDKIPGSTDIELFGAEVGEAFRKDDLISIQSDKPHIFLENVQYPNGEIVPFETLKAPLYNTEGELIGLLGLSRNISERIMFEETLVKNDLLLKELTANVPGMIFQFLMKPDRSVCIPYASKGIDSIFEVSAEDVKEDARFLLQRLHLEDHHLFIESIRFSKQNLSTWNAEFRLLLPEKGLRWFNGIAKPRELENGSVMWHGYILDITEQKQTQQLLRESEEQLKAIFNSLDEVIWAVELPDFSYKYISPSCEKLLGYNQNDFMTRPDLSFRIIHPEDRLRVENSIEEIIKNEKGEMEYRILTPQGKDKWIYNKAWVVKPEGNNPVRIEGISMDITERKTAELNLQQSEERFDLALRYTISGLWDWDMKNGGVYYSLTWKQMLGYDDHEIEADFNGWKKLWHPDDVVTVENAIKDYMQGITDKYEIEHRLKNKNGEYQWIFAKGTIQKNELGEAVRWLGINIDITQRKKLENDLLYRSSLQNVLMNLAGNLINLPVEATENAINETLRRIGSFVKADRAYMFDYDMEAMTVSNTYEWCADGIAPEIENLQNVPVDAITHWLDAFKNGSSFLISDVFALPENDPVRDILEPQGVQSIISVPLIRDKKLIGFIGFDAVKEKKVWTNTEQELLIFLAELLVNLSTRSLFENALIESESMLTMATEASNTAVWNWNIDTNKISYNKQMAKMLDLNPAELSLRPESFFERIHREDYDNVIPAINDCIEGIHLSFDEEYRVMDNSGIYLWIHDSGSVVEFDQDSKPLRLSGTRTNITARKKIEIDLKISEERFRSFYNNTALGLYRTTPDGEILMVNPALAEMQGFDDVDELLKRNTIKDKMISDEERQRFNRLMEENGEVRGFETIWKKKNGEPVYIRENSIPFKDANGEVIYYDGTAEDISDRKKAEMALRESEEKFRLLAENIDDMIYLLSADGSEIVYVNPAFERISALDRNILYNNLNVFFNSLTEEDKSNIQRKYFEYLKGVDPLDFDYCFTNEDGSSRWVKNRTVRVYDMNGKLKGHVGVASDITKLKEAEQSLLETLMLEKQLGELKTRFVSMASHEFRTPLATVMATTETLKAYRKRMSDSELEARLDKILSQVSHLKSIMDDVLNLAKTKEGKLSFEPGRSDLNELIHEIGDEFLSHPSFGHRLNIALSSDILVFDFDVKLMRQIISNLISNAAKYSANDTEIEVAVEENEDEIVLKVTDKGIGIPESEISNMFQPFFRASNVGDRPGTGLGMPIVKDAVELHGGKLLINSKVNSGTTIQCIFPKNI
jgi:PAS domain S-box-containing protein